MVDVRTATKKMKITVCFPIADLRAFTSFEGLLSERPSWSAPQFGRDFIRALGGFKPSSEEDYKGETGWLRETELCGVSRGFAFASMPPLRADGKNYSLRVLQKSMFFDGVSSARVEYQFETLGDIKRAPIAAISEYLRNLQIRSVQHSGPYSKVPTTKNFGQSGILHAISVAERTIQSPGFAHIQEMNDFVRASRPIILYELAPNEEYIEDYGFIRVNGSHSNYVEILHDREKNLNNVDVPVWLINKKANISTADAVKLPLYLKRIHCEAEVLFDVLRSVIIKAININSRSDRQKITLDQYIRELIFRINKSSISINRKHAFNTSTEGDQSVLSVTDFALVSLRDVDQNRFAWIEKSVDQLGFPRNGTKNQVKKFTSEGSKRAGLMSDEIKQLNDDSNISDAENSFERRGGIFSKSEVRHLHRVLVDSGIASQGKLEALLPSAIPAQLLSSIQDGSNPSERLFLTITALNSRLNYSALVEHPLYSLIADVELIISGAGASDQNLNDLRNFMEKASIYNQN